MFRRRLESSLVIGLTVVAFGTSAPEMAVPDAGESAPPAKGGLLLSVGYALAGVVLLNATRHQAKAGYSAVMLQCVLPLLALTLGVHAFQTWRSPRAGAR